MSVRTRARGCCSMPASASSSVRASCISCRPAAPGGPGFLSTQDARASLRYGFATLLRHGVTTVLAFAPAGRDGGETMLEVAAEFGVRLVWTPIIQGGRYWLNDDGSVDHEEDEAMGLKMLDEATAFIERHRGRNDGRLSGVIAVDEFYASTPTLRRAAKKAANALGVPFTLHFVEQHREFFETMMKTARTPAQLLADEGVLDRNTILAHCIYIAGHSLVGYPLEDDIALLGQAGASVAHSPVAFSRRGVALESFDRYRAGRHQRGAGHRRLPARPVRRDAHGVDHVQGRPTATTRRRRRRRCSMPRHGRAPGPWGRDDLGHLAAGALADLVIVDPRSLTIGPNPMRCACWSTSPGPDDVDLVMVGGRVLVEGGRLAMADEQQILADAAAVLGERVGRVRPLQHNGQRCRRCVPALLPARSGLGHERGGRAPRALRRRVEEL